MRRIYTPINFQTLRRWLGSRLQRVSEWQYKSAYWKLRRKVLNIDFRLANRLFLIKEYFRSRRESASAHRVLLSGIFKPLVLAVVIISFLELIEFSALR